VVPLKDLVKDDAIHEPSEADPEEEPGQAVAGNSLGGCFHVRVSTAVAIRASPTPSLSD
jgi:hypothetical protein